MAVLTKSSGTSSVSATIREHNPDMRANTTRVAIAHVSMGRGGSEATAVWGIQAIKDEYDVALLTAGKVRQRDLDDLNRYYGTRLRFGDFRVLEAPVLPGMRGTQSGAAIRGALFQRFCRKVAGRFDVLVSAYNLCDFGAPAVHFIGDFGWDPEVVRQFDSVPEEGQRFIHRDGPLRKAYLGFSRLLARPTGRDLFGGEDWIVVNSHWTRRLMAERYGVRNARVVYPPVLAEWPRVAFDDKEWGFVCIGRITREKSTEKIIEILRRVRKRGHAVHLHVIGPIDGSPYGQMIRRLCTEHAAWVIAEGQKTGAEKARLLTQHRFGIHACPREAFGIAVAEMVKGGAIPFVPSSGGPVEIIDEPSLCYEGVDDAVAKIDAVLRDVTRQRELATALTGRATRFSTDHFADAFRDVVAGFVASRPGHTGQPETR